MGTPTGTDFNSIMNGATCGAAPTALSNFDIIALQFLYPANPPAAGTVPVFRYYTKETTQDHYYTTNYNELGNGSNNHYIFEGIGFFAFPTQVSGSVPVYRYYRDFTGDHLFTRNYSELGSGGGGYVYEGIRFYAYPSAINGSVPVYRYYNGNWKDHFYTKNQNEFYPEGQIGYAAEGIAFYAY